MRHKRLHALVRFNDHYCTHRDELVECDAPGPLYPAGYFFLCAIPLLKHILNSLFSVISLITRNHLNHSL